MNERLQPSGKKPYKEPALKVYGDIQVLTNTLSNMGSLDGPKMKIDKTI
jgi:hypothetical protein